MSTARWRSGMPKARPLLLCFLPMRPLLFMCNQHTSKALLSQSLALCNESRQDVRTGHGNTQANKCYQTTNEEGFSDILHTIFSVSELLNTS